MSEGDGAARLVALAAREAQTRRRIRGRRDFGDMNTMREDYAAGIG